MRWLAIVTCLWLAGCQPEADKQAVTQADLDDLRAEIEGVKSEVDAVDDMVMAVEARVEEVATDQINGQAEDATAQASLATDIADIEARTPY